MFGDDAEAGEEKTDNEDETSGETVATVNVPAGEHEETMFEKANHFIDGHNPGEMKEKASVTLDEMDNKLKGLFS